MPEQKQQLHTKLSIYCNIIAKCVALCYNRNMKLLHDYMLRYADCHDDGVVLAGGFLNHNIDTLLLQKIGEEFARIFAKNNVTKILTVEASGICFAVSTAFALNNVPVLFAKKSVAKNTNGDEYCADVKSYTRNTVSTIRIPQQYLTSQDRVLIIDDFLAHGQAVLGLKSIVEQSGATLVGVGIVVEKQFEPGGKLLREMGINVHSLAEIKQIVNRKPIFADND